MKKQTTFILTIALLLTIGGSYMAFGQYGNKHRIKPSSTYITHQMTNVKDFDALRASTSIDIEYTQLKGAPKVEIYCPDNLLEVLDITIENGTLIAKFKPNTNIQGSFKVKVIASSSALKMVDARSSGDIIIKGDIESNAFHATAQSSGDIKFNRIKCGSINLNASSSGDIVGGYIVSLGKASVDASSSGDVEVNSLKASNINVSSSSSGDFIAKQVEGENITMSASSSGDIEVDDLIVNTVDAKASSSGDIKLSGSAINATFTSSSSGSIEARYLKAQSVSVLSSSGGSIYCYASEEINEHGKSSSGGGIYFYGDPKRVNLSYKNAVKR